MSDHAVEHDYHLVDPSPWPFLSGCAALVWGLGMVTFFAGLVDRTGENPLMEFFFSRGMDTIQGREGASGGWIILLIGCLFASYVMYAWWRDVVREAEAGDHTPVVDIGLRYGMIMFIMQEAMFCSLKQACSTKNVKGGTKIFWRPHPVMRIGRPPILKPLTPGTYH